MSNFLANALQNSNGKFETSQLIGHALDWAVAKCADLPFPFVYDEQGEKVAVSPSTDWAQGGPIIERENIGLVCQQIGSTQGCAYRHTESGEVFYYYGQTPLVAAMRCYVASKLGDEVELPEEMT